MPEEITFGQWLKQKRKELDLTQEALAERVGCSVIAIRKMEAGERRPSKRTADLLADFLKMPPEERAEFVSFARGLNGYEQPKSAPHAARPSPHANPLFRLTRLIGREAVASEVEAYLTRDGVRLLTLTGPPGIGKTSLAVHVQNALPPHFRDGVFFVPLAAISDPAGVGSVVARVLGVTDKGRPILESVLEFVRSKQLLLVLDNFEHVIGASSLVVELLAQCPGLKVLVTSREALRIAGEQQFQVPPLETADLMSLPVLPTLGDVPAVALFIERARAVRPDFTLTDRNAPAIAAICTRLEGVPLAIELAAARVSLLSPQEIETRLGDSLNLLESPARYLPEKQRTLRGTIDWSYNLLDEGEQKLFSRLGVFAGGFTLGAGEAVCNAGGDLPIDVLAALSSLLDKSLLKQEEGMDGASLFTMLEILRAYAVERLQESGDLPVLREQHAQYYLSLAQKGAAQLEGKDALTWLNQLDQAYANIRAAIAWSISNEDGATTALRFVGALQSFWIRRGYVTEERYFLSTALDRAVEVRSPEKANALLVAGRLALFQEDSAAGLSLLTQSLDLYRELSDGPGLSMVLNRLGTEYNRRGDFQQGRRALEEALAIARESGDPKAVVEALGHLGSSIVEYADHREALPLFEESLALARQVQDKGRTGSVLLSIGDIARLDGDPARARSAYEESIALFEASGAKTGRAFALANLAHVVLKEGDAATAASLLAEGFAHFRQMGYKRGLLLCLVGFGALHLLRDDLTRAITLLGAIQSAIDRDGIYLEKADQREFAEHLAMARAPASDAVWSVAWARGQSLTLEQAISYALDE